MQRRSLIALFTTLLLPVLPMSALAQAWPTKGPIRLVAVFPPGGSVDQVARILAPALQAQLGQTVIVENKGGASGAIGTGEVARAAPDGYTFAVVFDTHGVNPALQPNLPFDTKRDLAAVALVGTSGGGKTTMAGLLPRFFDVTGGQVLIDGTDVRDLRIEDLRGLMGIVTQDSILFNDTVANNIRYGRPEATMQEVEAAAKAAYADEFIAELPMGYETVIGERGGQLSGGRLHGFGQLHEACVQLRGEGGARQVPGTPEVAAVGVGANNSGTTAMLVTRGIGD